MFKMILFSVLTALFSSSAFAQLVEVSMLPASPVVINADTTISLDPNDATKTTTIAGPWFQANILIVNKSFEGINVEQQIVSFISTSGVSNTSTQPLNLGQVIPPNTAVQLQFYYSLAGLPAGEDVNGQIELSGKSISGAPFAATVSFVTTH